jgi:hypothetical protein
LQPAELAWQQLVPRHLIVVVLDMMLCFATLLAVAHDHAVKPLQLFKQLQLNRDSLRDGEDCHSVLHGQHRRDMHSVLPRFWRRTPKYQAIPTNDIAIQRLALCPAGAAFHQATDLGASVTT